MVKHTFNSSQEGRASCSLGGASARRFTARVECTRNQQRFQPWTLHRSILLVTGSSTMWLPFPCTLFQVASSSPLLCGRSMPAAISGLAFQNWGERCLGS